MAQDKTARFHRGIIHQLYDHTIIASKNRVCGTPLLASHEMRKRDGYNHIYILRRNTDGNTRGPRHSGACMQLQSEVEDQESGSCEMEFEGEHRWTARDRIVVANMEQYPNGMTT